MRTSRKAVWLVLALMAGSVMAASAADDKKMARAQQEQIQRLQQAKQTLEQDNARLTAASLDQGKQLRGVRADLLKTRSQARQADALQTELSGINADKAALIKQLEESLVAFGVLQKKAEADARQALALLTQTRAEAEQAAQAAAQAATQAAQAAQTAARNAARDKEVLTAVRAELNLRVASLSTCENTNAAMYRLNTDLLARYEKTATARSLAGGGIFTQIERVKIENEVTTYQDQLGDLKLTPQPKPQY
jgi:hypothetical protein